MKKLVEMVKMFTFSMVVAVMMILAMTCQANNLDNYDCTTPQSVTVLNRYIGNWYDTNGNLVLTIDSDYSINRCKILSVLSAFSKGGPYKIQISESGRSKYIDLEYQGSFRSFTNNPEVDEDVTGYHGYLVMNGQTVLRRTKNPQYFESVGGIYLGMNKNQVVSLYGQPSSKDDRRARPIWKYNREGMELRFVGNVVESIIIYPSGDRRFDWSGLSANSSVDNFYYKYNPTTIQMGRASYLNIGHGEMIYFQNGNVTLSLIKD